jgi:hypothetical protein
MPTASACSSASSPTDGAYPRVWQYVPSRRKLLRLLTPSATRRFPWGSLSIVASGWAGCIRRRRCHLLWCIETGGAGLRQPPPPLLYPDYVGSRRDRRGQAWATISAASHRPTALVLESSGQRQLGLPASLLGSPSYQAGPGLPSSATAASRSLTVSSHPAGPGPCRRRSRSRLPTRHVPGAQFTEIHETLTYLDPWPK